MDDFDFGFDTDDLDLGLDDSSDQDSSSSSTSDDDMGDFLPSTPNVAEPTVDRANMNKTIIALVVLGVIVIIAAIIIGRVVTGKKSAQNRVQNNVQSTVQTTVTQQPTVQNNTQTTTKNNQDSWTSISQTDGISFNSEKISAIFTITGIQHYAKVTDTTSQSLMVKSVLVGNISGYSGTYEVEVPYSVGCRLSTGKTFEVQVEVGEFEGKVVIGEISYK